MTQPQQQIGSNLANDFWQEQMQKHPNVYGILSTLGAVISFFINGHAIVVLGRWVIRVSGYIAETALLFAVLWITGTSIAPNLVELIITANVMQYLVSLALVVLALIPEIILANAIVNAVRHWLTVIRNRRSVSAWIWAVAFTVPTVLFFILTAITLNTLGANGGNIVQASTQSVNLRIDAGWIYGLLELTYAGVKKFQGPQQANTPVPQPVPVLPTLPTAEELALSLVPLLVPHLAEMRASILAEVQRSVPQINYQEIAQSLVPLLPVPMVPAIDHEAIARAVTPLLSPAFVEVRRTIIEEVKGIVVPQMGAGRRHPVAQIGTTISTSEESDKDRDTRLERAYQTLIQEGKRPSANALYVLANCNRKAAQEWLRTRTSGTDSIISGTDDTVTVPSVGVTSGTDVYQQSHRDTDADLEVVPVTSGTDSK